MSDISRVSVQHSMHPHFPKIQSLDFVNYANNVALLWSRYMFTRRIKGKQYGYCTHCNKESLTVGLKQGVPTTCINCNSKCLVKSSGRKRGKMVDEAQFVYYFKSEIDPQTIVARCVYVIRDYRNQFTNVDTEFVDKALYVFTPGGSNMISRSAYFSSYIGSGYIGQWEQKSSVHSLTNNSLRRYHSVESIEEAVKGTPFQYSTWDKYTDYAGDMVKFFDLYSKFPCIEYLTKLDLGEIVKEKLYGRPTFGAVNWKGKTLNKVLRLSKPNINELRKSKVTIESLHLRLLQISAKHDSKLTIDEIVELEEMIGSNFKVIEKIIKHTTLGNVYSYLKKQFKLNKKHFVHMREVITTWRDYIQDCIKLDMDLSDPTLLAPKDLRKSHQDTIAKVKYIADTALNEQIGKRVKTLKKYQFEHGGLILRPVSDSIEMMKEGNALNHCVGGYTARYAKGETDIFVIRSSEHPDTPFYTLQITKARIDQCRGKRNCPPTPEVKAFLDLFISKKLLTSKRVRVDVTNINRVEVAI